MASNIWSSALIIIFLGAGLSPRAAAQQIIEDQNIRALRAHYTSFYGRYERLRGYRVQISNTTDRRQMESTLAKCRSTHPELQPEWSYNAPYYKIVVGAFMTRMQADAALYQLRKDFRGSVVIHDEVLKTELLR